MRGVRRASFMGPENSALKICEPPTPSAGRMATARTRIPMPPSQDRKQRQKLIDSGRLSRLDSTEAQVVVTPLMASKKARVKVMLGMPR